MPWEPKVLRACGAGNGDRARGGNRADPQETHGPVTGFVWQRWQSIAGNATGPWHTPQNFALKMSSIVYFVVPAFTA
jgi:hypothetical protein